MRQSDKHIVQVSKRIYDTEDKKKQSEAKKIHFLIGTTTIIQNVIQNVLENDGVVLTRTWAAAFDYVQDIDEEQAILLKDIYNSYCNTPIQIREEIVKANIIQEYPQYKELLFKIEDNELLRGHITFVLQCAGYNGDINSIDWDILLKVCNVFRDYFNSEDKLTDELRRTMLTIEVERKYEFYHYWWSYWNVGQAVKRKLFVQFREIEYFIGSDYKEYFKKLVLLLTKKTYDEILREFIFPKDMPNWKRRLIKEETLLSGTSKYIAIPDDNSFCYLLKSRRPRDINGGTKIE